MEPNEIIYSIELSEEKVNSNKIYKELHRLEKECKGCLDIYQKDKKYSEKEK